MPLYAQSPPTPYWLTGLQKAIAELSREARPTDSASKVISPNALGWLDFHRAEEAIAAGKAATETLEPTEATIAALA